MAEDLVFKVTNENWLRSARRFYEADKWLPIDAARRAKRDNQKAKKARRKAGRR